MAIFTKCASDPVWAAWWDQRMATRLAEYVSTLPCILADSLLSQVPQWDLQLIDYDLTHPYCRTPFPTYAVVLLLSSGCHLALMSCVIYCSRCHYRDHVQIPARTSWHCCATITQKIRIVMADSEFKANRSAIG